MAFGPKKLEEPFNPPQEEEAVLCFRRISWWVGLLLFSVGCFMVATFSTRSLGFSVVCYHIISF